MEIPETVKNKYLNNTVETDYNRFKTTETVTTETSNGLGFWNDSLYADIPDLVNNKFRAWYCDAFYKLGKERTLALIKEARREGKNPARYFSYLIKQALNG